MTKKFSLGKDERLKSRKQIEKIFDEGKKFSITPFRVHYLLNDIGIGPLQFSVGVSNKNFKKAVDRNKIKRITREAWRLQKKELDQKLNNSKKFITVFLIYTGKVIAGYKDVYTSVAKIIEKIDFIIKEAV